MWHKIVPSGENVNCALKGNQKSKPIGSWGQNRRTALLPVMSVAELQESVLALPQRDRHEFVVWINRLEAGYGDVPGEALDQLAAEIRDEDDRHAPPTHPGR